MSLKAVSVHMKRQTSSAWTSAWRRSSACCSATRCASSAASCDARPSCSCSSATRASAASRAVFSSCREQSSRSTQTPDSV